MVASRDAARFSPEVLYGYHNQPATVAGGD